MLTGKIMMRTQRAIQQNISKAAEKKRLLQLYEDVATEMYTRFGWKNSIIIV